MYQLKTRTWRIPREPRANRLITCAFLIFALAFPLPAAAQVDPLVTAGLAAWGGVELGDLLKQFSQEAQGLIQDGQNVGNALEVREGNELGVFAQNIHDTLGDEESHTFRDLDYQSQLVVAQELRIENEIASAKSWALDFKDSTYLDLYSALGQLPFVQEKFLVTSLRGLTQLETAGGDYRISFFASKLAPFSQGQSSSISLSLAAPGTPLATGGFVRINPNRVVIGDNVAHRIDYYVPSATLNSYFASNAMQVVNGSFAVTIRSQKCTAILFCHNEDDAYTFPISLALLPYYAGTVSGSGSQDQYGWVDIATQTASQDAQDMDCHHRDHDDCGHPDIQSYDWSLPTLSQTRTAPPFLFTLGSRRYDYSRVSLTCSPGNQVVQLPIPFGNPQQITVLGPCNWASASPSGPAPDYPVISAHATNWSLPCTWTLSAPEQEWQRTGSTPYSIAPQQLFWGSIVDIEFADNTSNVKLSGTTLDHRTFQVVVGNADPNNILRLVSVEATQHGTHIAHYIPQPLDLGN